MNDKDNRSSRLFQGNNQKKAIRIPMSSKFMYVPVRFPTNNTAVQTLLDSGASTNHIRLAYLQANKYLRNLPQIELHSGSGATNASGAYMAFLFKIRAKFEIDGHTFSQEFTVVEDLSLPVILGQQFFKDYEVTLSSANKEIVLNHNPICRLQEEVVLQNGQIQCVKGILPGYYEKNQILSLNPVQNKMIYAPEVAISCNYSGRFNTCHLLLVNSSAQCVGPTFKKRNSHRISRKFATK